MRLCGEYCPGGSLHRYWGRMTDVPGKFVGEYARAALSIPKLRILKKKAGVAMKELVRTHLQVPSFSLPCRHILSRWEIKWTLNAERFSSTVARSSCVNKVILAAAELTTEMVALLYIVDEELVLLGAGGESRNCHGRGCRRLWSVRTCFPKARARVGPSARSRRGIHGECGEDAPGRSTAISRNNALFNGCCLR